MDPFAALDHYRKRVLTAQDVLLSIPDDPALLVRWMRTRFSLTVKDLAAMLGKSPATVNRWTLSGPNAAATSHLHLLIRQLLAIEAQIETPGDAG